MIRLLLVVAIAFSGYAQNLKGLEEEAREFAKFSNKQKQVLKRAYEIGLPFNMGYTLAAIAWQESMAGKYLINLQDPSAGVFHNNLNSVMRRHHEIPDTPFQRNRIAQRLIEDIDFSGAEALAELEYWKNVHGEGKWFLIWQSYNGGFAYLSTNSIAYRKSYHYAQGILRKIRFLRRIGIFATEGKVAYGQLNSIETESE